METEFWREPRLISHVDNNDWKSIVRLPAENSFGLKLRITYNGLGDIANYFPTVARIKQRLPKIIIPVLSARMIMFL